MITTYEAKRRLKVGQDLWIEPTEKGGPPSLVPQVVIWPRHESFLHTGHVREIVVTEEDFDAALEAAVPPLTELEIQRIKEHHGLGDSYGLHGPHKTPFTRTQVLKEAAADRARLAAAENPVNLPGPVPRRIILPLRPAQIVTPPVKVALQRAPRTRPVKKVAAKKAAPRGA